MVATSGASTESLAGTGTASPMLLELHGISKSFPGVRALESVDFTLRAGEIHALLGENGAGKSTLIKVLTGVFPRDDGEILLAGRPVEPRSPLHAQALGISTVYQEINLIPYLSVAENICLGRQPLRFRRIDWKALQRRARAALDRLGIALDVGVPLNECSIAIQQMVAIARTIDQNPERERQTDDAAAAPHNARILALDEPTSSLDANEVAQLFGVMQRLKQRGFGIIFITHFLDQVYAISDRLTILRNGRLAGTYETAALPRLELIARMLGQDVRQAAELTRKRGAAPPPRSDQRPILRARGLTRSPAVAPFDLDMNRGEIVGLAGLLGSGRTEIARLIFGIDRPDRGSLNIDGRPLRTGSPRRAIDAGLGFCPEDRKTDGVFGELSVRENIVLALQANQGIWHTLTRKAQQQLAEHYIRTLNIITPDAETPVGRLSGGNQQKVILARWLAARPRLLILDEPTRGIDVGAKAEIERLMAQLCASGLAILFISSELEEVVRNCHVVAVLHDGRKTGELAGAAINMKSILELIAAGGGTQHD